MPLAARSIPPAAASYIPPLSTRQLRPAPVAISILGVRLAKSPALRVLELDFARASSEDPAMEFAVQSLNAGGLR